MQAHTGSRLSWLNSTKKNGLQGSWFRARVQRVPSGGRGIFRCFFPNTWIKWGMCVEPFTLSQKPGDTSPVFRGGPNHQNVTVYRGGGGKVTCFPQLTAGGPSREGNNEKGNKTPFQKSTVTLAVQGETTIKVKLPTRQMMPSLDQKQEIPAQGADQRLKTCPAGNRTAGCRGVGTSRSAAQQVLRGGEARRDSPKENAFRQKRKKDKGPETMLQRAHARRGTRYKGVINNNLEKEKGERTDIAWRRKIEPSGDEPNKIRVSQPSTR